MDNWLSDSPQIMLLIGIGLLLVHDGYSYPFGVPSGVCQYMIPNAFHHGSGADTPVEYTIEFPNEETTYTPGVPITGNIIVLYIILSSSAFLSNNHTMKCSKSIFKEIRITMTYQFKLTRFTNSKCIDWEIGTLRYMHMFHLKNIYMK